MNPDILLGIWLGVSVAIGACITLGLGVLAAVLLIKAGGKMAVNWLVKALP